MAGEGEGDRNIVRHGMDERKSTLPVDGAKHAVTRHYNLVFYKVKMKKINNP